MPIVNGNEVIELTAAQLDEFLYKSSFMSIAYTSLSSTPVSLFSNKTVAASSTVTNATAVDTSGSAKMQVTYSQTGLSSNCTMILYGTSHPDLSMASVLTTLTLGTNQTPANFAIETPWIPKYTFASLVNNDLSNPATCNVEITVWK